MNQRKASEAFLKHLKAHNLCAINEGGFSLFALFSCNFDGQFSTHFHSFVISSLWRDTPSGETGLVFDNIILKMLSLKLVISVKVST